MSTIVDTQPLSDRELVLARRLEAPPANVFRAWTEAELLERWFAPAPFSTTTAELDVRVGGASLIVMRAPDGTLYPNRGVYLAVVPNAHLVMTDAFDTAWVPSAKPFLLLDLTFAPADGNATLYTARARHWSVEDRERHEQMGFHQGWSLCTDQLEVVARGL